MKEVLAWSLLYYSLPVVELLSWPFCVFCFLRGGICAASSSSRFCCVCFKCISCCWLCPNKGGSFGGGCVLISLEIGWGICKCCRMSLNSAKSRSCCVLKSFILCSDWRCMNNKYSNSLFTQFNDSFPLSAEDVSSSILDRYKQMSKKKNKRCMDHLWPIYTL